MLDLGSTLIASVERDPDRVAIVDDGVALSYREWLARIDGLGRGLSALGLARGDRLVSVAQNSHHAATLHWACQLRGIVITPVNWRVKSDELDFVLEDANAAALVFEPVCADAVAGSQAAERIARIACSPHPLAQRLLDDLIVPGDDAPVPQAAPEDVSVMLYTSGTTGRGKGVPRSHFAERQSALAHVAQNRYGYAERTLGVMPLYHTMGVRSLLAMALVNGAFICQPHFDRDRALELIERHAVSNLYLVPTLFHDLLDAPRFASADVSSVRKLGFAGAPMTEDLLKRVNAAFEPELFVNHYGSSEIYTFTINSDAVAKPGSAGKAGINQRVRVVRIESDSPDALATVGEEGEIIAALASDEAFAGYWQRPDADARALRNGWYFTGDVGYFDADGDLFVTGRVDDMMISGGENIMPVEIESVLSLHPSVSEVAVAGLPDDRLGQKVTAFIRRAAAVDREELDRFCKQSQLADFKRPRDYVFVHEIPKSPVGKILRRMLLAGEYQRDD